MYPNLKIKIGQNWSNFAKDIDQKSFCPKFNGLFK